MTVDPQPSLSSLVLDPRFTHVVIKYAEIPEGQEEVFKPDGKEKFDFLGWVTETVDGTSSIVPVLVTHDGEPFTVRQYSAVVADADGPTLRLSMVVRADS